MPARPVRAAKNAVQTAQKAAAEQTNVTERAARSAARYAQEATDAQAEAAEEITRNAAQSARAFADAAFTAPSFEVPEVFRSVAEQGLTQTREAYGRMKAAAEQATELFEESFDATRESLRDMQFKSLDAARANADATFDFARDLLAVNSVADAIQLQTAFARERFEALVDYYKDVQTTLTKVSTEAVRPARAAFDRALNEANAG